jgi:hypothetical protein
MAKLELKHRVPRNPGPTAGHQDTGMARLPEIGSSVIRLLLFVVVERLPEADPDIEQSKAAAETSEEPVIHHRAQAGIREQEVVVSPLRRPREDDEQYASHCTNQDKEKDRNAVHPELDGVRAGRRSQFFWRIENCRGPLGLRPGRFRQLAGRTGEKRGVGHSFGPRAGEPCARPIPGETAWRRRWRARSPERRRLVTKPIEIFYDFRALMRSETSR